MPPEGKKTCYPSCIISRTNTSWQRAGKKCQTRRKFPPSGNLLRVDLQRKTARLEVFFPSPSGRGCFYQLGVRLSSALTATSASAATQGGRIDVDFLAHHLLEL